MKIRLLLSLIFLTSNAFTQSLSCVRSAFKINYAIDSIQSKHFKYTNYAGVSPINTNVEMKVFKTEARDTFHYYMEDKSVLTEDQENKLSSLGKDNTNDPTIFFNLGIGMGMFKDLTQMSNAAELGYVFNKNIITIRNLKISESKQFLGGVSPNERISDYGALFGRITDDEHAVLSASVGIAFTRGIIRGKYLNNSGGWISFTSYYEALPFQTIGIPMEAEVLFGARHNFNFSLVAYANVNLKYSFGGFLICLRLGAAKTYNKSVENQK